MEEKTDLTEQPYSVHKVWIIYAGVSGIELFSAYRFINFTLQL